MNIDQLEATTVAGVARLESELAATRDELAALRRERDVLQGVFRCFARFGASLGDTRDAFRDLSFALAEQRSSAAAAAEQSERHRAEFQRTADVLDALFGDISRVAQQVDALARSANRIDGSVRSIRGIAEQTRLLAINAQIEAARAGDSGRGFAVVAEEVGKLATRAQQATVDIAGLLTGIRDESHQAQSIMGRAAEQARQCGAQSGQSMRDAQALVARQRAIEAASAGCALLANVEFANLEEIILKRDVYLVLFNVTELQADDFPDATSCRLGHWYYSGEGRDNFAGLAGYGEIEAPHKAMHAHARAAVAEHRALRSDASLRELDAMEHANQTVTSGLRRILAGRAGA